MRYYGFGNYYLSSLQQGLQAHHVCVEMFNAYGRFRDLQANGQIGDDHVLYKGWLMLDDWAQNHKTIVLLNGGNSADLAELRLFLMKGGSEYPYSAFREDEQSLNSAMTSVGIILPAKIYDNAAIRRRGGEIAIDNFTAWELELMDRLNQYGLAK